LRVFVVLNPVAGRTPDGEVRGLLERYVDSAEWQLEVVETTGEEPRGALVRGAVAGGVDMVFAAGGDGTVSAVADGLAYSDIPMGIIPSGTSNVLSQDLELPLNVEKACRMLSNRETTTRTIDAIQVGEQYFLIGVGAGADAEVAGTPLLRMGRRSS
jgi:diacylglycerol kinase family enzyme